jgi:hypothetical protein
MPLPSFTQDTIRYADYLDELLMRACMNMPRWFLVNIIEAEANMRIVDCITHDRNGQMMRRYHAFDE